MKRCLRCNKLKQLEEFEERADRPGRFAWCKTCMRLEGRSKELPPMSWRGDGSGDGGMEALEEKTL